MEESGPLVEEFYLGESNLEAFYVSDPCSAMAVQPAAPIPTKRARYIEAHGYHRKPPAAGQRQCYVVDSFDDLDDISIAATKRGLLDCITDGEIAEIRASYEEITIADPWWIALDTRQHVHVVIAVLDNLAERGDLPPRLD